MLTWLTQGYFFRSGYPGTSPWVSLELLAGGGRSLSSLSGVRSSTFGPRSTVHTSAKLIEAEIFLRVSPRLCLLDQSLDWATATKIKRIPWPLPSQAGMLRGQDPLPTRLSAVISWGWVTLLMTTTRREYQGGRHAVISGGVFTWHNITYYLLVIKGCSTVYRELVGIDNGVVFAWHGIA